MSEVARVLLVIPSVEGTDPPRKIDRVTLKWQDQIYHWITERYKYRSGQEVAINPPTTESGNITPA